MGVEDADEPLLIAYLFCIPAPYSLGNFIAEGSFMGSTPLFLNLLGSEKIVFVLPSLSWSGIWESNPSLQLGKLTLSRSTNPA